jgi:solute carrier family 25 (mitochondrial carnitine/acylcarnitine transporter), member 20/29
VSFIVRFVLPLSMLRSDTLTNEPNVGVCNVFVGHPIDLIKVRQQIGTATASTASTTAPSRQSSMMPIRNGVGTLGMLRSIAHAEGLAGLYAGVTAPRLAVVPAFAITFSSYEAAKAWQLRRRATFQSSPQAVLTLKESAIAGGCSGVPLALVVGPLERIKCLMQIDKSRYSTFSSSLQSVYRDGGLRSVFRGTGLTILRDVPGNAVYFAGYESTRRTLRLSEPSLPDVLVTLLAGGMAGVANWIVAIPMDVIKSRWQTAPTTRYRNYQHVLQDLLAREGPAALFKGLGPALLRAFPANAACLLGVETVKTLLS